MRKIIADFLQEVCIDVKEEPLLQKITGEVFKIKAAKRAKDARLDILVRVFWMQDKRYLRGFLTH